VLGVDRRSCAKLAKITSGRSSHPGPDRIQVKCEMRNCERVIAKQVAKRALWLVGRN